VGIDEKRKVLEISGEKGKAAITCSVKRASRTHSREAGRISPEDICLEVRPRKLGATKTGWGR